VDPVVLLEGAPTGVEAPLKQKRKNDLLLTVCKEVSGGKQWLGACRPADLLTRRTVWTIHIGSDPQAVKPVDLFG